MAAFRGGNEFFFQLGNTWGIELRSRSVTWSCSFSQEIRQLASPGGASTAGGEASPFGRRSPASEPLLLEPPASMSAPAGAGYAAAPMVHRASPGGYDLRGHRRPPPPPGACSSLRFVALAQPGGAAVGRRGVPALYTPVPLASAGLLFFSFLAENLQ
ncbi:hypothetical protein MRX96_037449 [Rhipicephalus microplus]